jgi:hypothetical protein
LFAPNQTPEKHTAGNTGRLVLACICIITAAGGCASYQPATIRGLGDEGASRRGASGAQSEEIAVTLISADIGDMVRVTLLSHRRISGRIEELTDKEMVLIIADGGGHNRVIARVSEIDRLEVRSSSRALEAGVATATIVAASMALVMVSVLSTLR